MKYLKLASAVTTAMAMLLGAAALHAQTVYRIVGPDGKVTFSDKPPAATTATVTARSASGRLAEGNLQNSNLPYELRQVVARFPVTLYAGAGCVPCNAGRLMLQARGIPYTEYAVASNEDVEALQRLSGEKSLPYLTIGGQKIKGYSEAEWSQFLNAANYPATSQLPSNFRNLAPKPLVSTQKLSTQPETAETREAEEEPAAAASAAPTPGASPANPAGIKF